MAYLQESIKPYNDTEKKSVQVEKMFDNIAPEYDRLNHTLSLGIVRSGRRKAIKQLHPFHPKRILDIATGTGDFALLTYQALHPDTLIGCDISEGMMQIGVAKVKKAGLSQQISFTKEDCTQLSFANESFDAVTVAFGVRNFENLDKALREMHRVLTPQGKLVILELSTPTQFPIKQCYHLYSKLIIPSIGKLLSKDRDAYHYLPASIKAFPQGEVMEGILKKAGFSQVTFQRLTLGICTLYTATK